MTRKRWLFALLLLPVIAYLLVAIVAFFGQRELLYPIRWMPQALARAPVYDGVELWTMARDGGVVEAYWMPAPGDEVRGVVVFFHGNGQTIDALPSLLHNYHRLGFHVLIPEYRGYGRSAGTPTEEGICEDVVAWIDRAIARPEVDGGRLVLHGYSLGGGVAGSVARVREPRAMILESTFRSIPHMAWGKGLPGFLARDVYDTQGWLERWKGPVMLEHGRADRVVPFSHGEVLSRVRPGISFRAHDGGHMPAWGRAYWDRVRDFLRREVMEVKED